MELKPGYKQTEVGVIPEDWSHAIIRDLSKMITVGFVGSMAHLFRRNGVPLLRGQNVLPGKLELSDPRYIDRQTHALWRKSALQPGDVVLVRVGYPGTCAKIPRDLGEANAASLVVVRPDSETLDSDYLCYVLLSPIGKKQIDASLVGGAQQVINIGTAAQLQIPLPPTLAEQKAIADALSDADALIDSLEQLIAKKRLLKQGAMQDLLTGNKRLPGFEGEWEVKRLSELGRYYRGVSYNPAADLSPHETDSTVRLLRSNNVQESQLDFEDMQFVTEGRVSPDQYLRQNDILICMANGSRRLVGKAAQCPKLADKAYTFGAFMGCFRPDPAAADEQFVSGIFNTENYRRHIDLLLAGSSINNLSPGNVESLEIPVPAQKAEQTAIAAILSDMDLELAALEAKLAKARQVKQGMMQELLTGKTRLV